MSTPETTLFPAQDSVLSQQAIVEQLLPLYGLPEPHACRFHRKGICDTYAVQASARSYYLKVYRTGRRTLLDVSEEVRLLIHLHNSGVSVVRPVVRRDGTFVSLLRAPEGVRCAVLFEAVAGESERTDDHRRRMGSIIARMHAASDLMSPPYQRHALDMTTLVDENLRAIEPLMVHRKADFSLVCGIGGSAVREVHSLLPGLTAPEYGPCHGDIHGGDVLYDPQGAPTLLDFDSSGCGWRAVDLGVYLCHEWMDTTPSAEAERQRRLGLVLEGYERVRALSENELSVVQLVPAIRHIFLMGHVLRYTTTYTGWSWADDGFLDWHMAWFRNWATRHRTQ